MYPDYVTIWLAQVMCLFCEEEPASEQAPAVHKRDRFCSVECMEVRLTSFQLKYMREVNINCVNVDAIVIGQFLYELLLKSS